MKKIISVIGARPQFIKAAVLSRIIREKMDFSEVIIHTGQHFDKNMSEVFFQEMDIPEPTYNLNIHGLGHGAMTGRMLEEIEKVLLKEQPALVVVYGDTNSTLAGALAARKLGIPVAHVEAGLRSFDMDMPEEVNRILTDRISDLLLCPTKSAVSNLKAEGYEQLDTEIRLTGDIMKDSVEFYSGIADEKSEIIQRTGLGKDEFILATIHRQENTDDPVILRDIMKGLNAIDEKVKVVLPLHPRTREMMKQFGISFKGALIDPVGYFDMLQLLKNCKLVITDSGGLQKEAYFNAKPCVIVREQTEWIELVENGCARIAGREPEKIMEAYLYFRQNKPDYSINLYGDQVGQAIYREILSFLKRNK